MSVLTLEEVKSQNFVRTDGNPYNFPSYDRSASKVVNECTHKHNPIKGKPIPYGGKKDHVTHVKRACSKVKFYEVKGMDVYRGVKKVAQALKTKYSTANNYCLEAVRNNGKWTTCKNYKGESIIIRHVKLK